MLDLRRFARALLGRDWYPGRDLRLATERLGSDYGGWEVVLDGLGPESVVYSAGIGEDGSFDVALIARFGLTVHGFDPTPRSLQWVGEQGLPPQFVMHGYGLADRDGEMEFYPPANPAHVSYSVVDRGGGALRRAARAAAPGAAGAIRVPMRTLGSIRRELGHRRVDLLKLDIEGAEYGVIEEMERSGERPGQLLVEFHHRFRGVGLGRTRRAVAALRRMGYGLFAVSETGEEYGFLLRGGAG